RHHNIKLVLPEGREVPLAIPYDFDYSGLVNAPYAVPYASLPISSVRERYFQWRGKDLAELEPAIQRFREQKEAILSTCRNLAGLQPQVRDDLIEYLESFYRALDNPQQLAAKN
ncbi:hypothetical protein RZS08_00310, partial [Arthrospira platensis SPKY1]|nr:hypothetical protein [Arthrospira platensis SPKY1]